MISSNTKVLNSPVKENLFSTLQLTVPFKWDNLCQGQVSQFHRQQKSDGYVLVTKMAGF